MDNKIIFKKIIIWKASVWKSTVIHSCQRGLLYIFWLTQSLPCTHYSGTGPPNLVFLTVILWLDHWIHRTRCKRKGVLE